MLCCGKIERTEQLMERVGSYNILFSTQEFGEWKSKNLQFYFFGRRCGKGSAVFFTTRIHAHSTQIINCSKLSCVLFFLSSLLIIAFNLYMRVADFAFLRFRLWEFCVLHSLLYKSSRHNHRIYTCMLYITLMLFNKVLSFDSKRLKLKFVVKCFMPIFTRILNGF